MSNKGARHFKEIRHICESKMSRYLKFRYIKAVKLKPFKIKEYFRFRYICKDPFVLF